MRIMSMTVAMLALSSTSAMAQTPPDVSDLVGARAAGGETQLEARGYRFVTTNVVRDSKWSFWWSDRQRQCISVTTTDGRYAAIGAIPAANCNAAVPQAPARPSAQRDAISLVCIGSGSGPAAQSNSGYRYNSKSRKFEPEFGTTLGREGFSSDLEIDISGGVGRIHPSGKLVSPIHSGGSDGWWPIADLMMTPDRISGSYRMNGMNKPRFDYNRRTRIIRVRAATEFTGRCEEQ